MCSAKSRWPRRWTRRAASSRARERRPHPRDHPEPPLPRRRAPHRARIASGAIGALTSVHADFFLGPHFGGFRETMDHVLLLDMAIHSFDAMRCMTGLQGPLASTAASGSRRTPGIARDRRPSRDLRPRERRGVHLSRQLVRGRPRHRMGMRLAHRRHAQGHACCGMATTTSAPRSPGSATGLFAKRSRGRRPAAR